jgi:hypothetical protein
MGGQWHCNMLNRMSWTYTIDNRIDIGVDYLPTGKTTWSRNFYCSGGTIETIKSEIYISESIWKSKKCLFIDHNKPSIEPKKFLKKQVYL